MIIIDAPFTSWQSAVATTRKLMEDGVEVVWCSGQRDPIFFLSAMSQMVPKIRLGLFLSALRGRPIVYAVRQLMTVDELSGGRLEISVDDERLFRSFEETCRKLNISLTVDEKSPRRARFSAVD